MLIPRWHGWACVEGVLTLLFLSGPLNNYLGKLCLTTLAKSRIGGKTKLFELVFVCGV